MNADTDKTTRNEKYADEVYIVLEMKIRCRLGGINRAIYDNSLNCRLFVPDSDVFGHCTLGVYHCAYHR